MRCLVLKSLQVLGTEGDEWVRHRSIARKSFGDRNNALVWSETVRILDDWFAPWDAAAEPTTTDVTDDLRHITLSIIASAGFGLKFRRENQGEPARGFTMSFGEALFTAIESMFLRIAAPRFLYALPIPALRRCDRAYSELERYIRQMTTEAREKVEGGEAADLFRRLVEANEAEGEASARLTDDELISNIYVYFLAGHETSAHALTFALALLALHPEVQEKLHEEAARVWPVLDGAEWRSSTISDF
ncbi:cytochrome P450, partial [Auricularia subglabra TFB-10046 SS5]